MSEHDARDRFSLYRLCECPECEGRGRHVTDVTRTVHKRDVALYGGMSGVPGVTRKREEKCPQCRGEGRIRQEVASCATAEAVGVALVTCGREGEWEGCAFGLLDREGEEGKRWLVLPWPSTARTTRAAAQELARKRHAETS